MSNQATKLSSMGLGLLDEDQLWTRRDDPRVTEELVNRYLAFAKGIALRYRRDTESMDDLIQVANVGLLNAIKRFDSVAGTPFVAFASPTIHGELKRHFRDRVSMLHIPRGIYDRIGQMERTVSGLRASLRREPTVAEIADQLGCSEDEIREARQAVIGRNADTLDAIDEHGDPLGQRLGFIDRDLDDAENRTITDSALRSLDPDDREIILLRFRDELSQSQIAERVGCSQMQISRKLRQILDQMNDVATAA